jgi:transcriptional regulator with XRE-family HTH domain
VIESTPTGPSSPAGLSFGQRILILRTRRNLTQRALADSAGVTPGYISLLEGSQRLASPRVTRALARGLQVTPMYLIKGVDQKTEDCIAAAVERGRTALRRGHGVAAHMEFDRALRYDGVAHLLPLKDAAILGRSRAIEGIGTAADVYSLAKKSRAVVTPNSAAWKGITSVACRSLVAGGRAESAGRCGETALPAVLALRTWTAIDCELVAALVSAHIADHNLTRASHLADQLHRRASRTDPHATLLVALVQLEVNVAVNPHVTPGPMVDCLVSRHDHRLDPGVSARAFLAAGQALLVGDAAEPRRSWALLREAHERMPSGRTFQNDRARCAIGIARGALLLGQPAEALVAARGAIRRQPVALTRAEGYVVCAAALEALGRRSAATVSLKRAEYTLSQVAHPAVGLSLWSEIADLYGAIGLQASRYHAMLKALTGL